jgi:hypothetical protein
MVYVLRVKQVFIIPLFALILVLAWSVASHAAPRSKQELEKEYFSASMRAVGKDAFPVLLNPSMGTVADGDKIIQANEWVIGIALNGEAKAYPIAVMGFHELINDSVGGHPITVCW